MRQIGRDSETPGKSWGFVILRPPSDFASLNSEFVNHSQGKMMRAGVGVFHETDQRVVARRVIRGEDATTDFTPGNYALVCFVEDPNTDAPHFALGMIHECTFQ